MKQINSRGYKYWQIVESRRVNGKPRPIVLAHLGTAASLLKKLLDENNRLAGPKSKKFTRHELNKRIDSIANSKKVGGLIEWKLLKKRNGPYYIEYQVPHEKLAQIESAMGFRIIMTNRHNWDSADIIKAYHGQSFIENDCNAEGIKRFNAVNCVTGNFSKYGLISKTSD